jgi:radical SAM superfamily enzyme YgiQ (UPF0313 family)
MKLLLIKSGNTKSRSTGITPPLGLMYIASYVRTHRHDDVRIFDIRLHKQYLKDIENIISNYKPDIVGISALTLEAPAMFQIAHLVKTIDKSIPIIVGGPHVSSVPEEVIQNDNIDIAVIGEGEITFKEILEAFEGERALETVDGICFRTDNERLTTRFGINIQGIYQNSNKKLMSTDTITIDNRTTVIKTNDRKYLQELDTLPFPAWDLIEIKSYAVHRSMSNVGIRPYMVVFTSRGCPFRCTYCHNIFGKRFRARSVENVIREMETLITAYSIRDFEIIDDVSNFDKERLKAICNEIINRGWKIRLSFPNGVRTDLLDEETIYLLKRVGTAEMSIAVETASPRLQKLIKKNLNLEKVQKMIDVAAHAGIFLRGFFMIGFPTETEEELKATINFACKSKLHIAFFFVLNPFKGTEIIKQIQHAGKQLPNINLESFDYMANPFNPSTIDDKKFHKLYMWAYIRFYANPMRIFRILRDKPMHNDLFIRLVSLVKNYIPAPSGNKKLKAQNKYV